MSEIKGMKYGGKLPKTIGELFRRLFVEANEILASQVRLQQMSEGMAGTAVSNTSTNANNNGSKGDRGKQQIQNPKQQQQNPQDETFEMCNQCGRIHGSVCKLADHPDRNQENMSWSDSKNGKTYMAGKPPLSHSSA